MSDPWIRRDGLWFDGPPKFAESPPWLVGHWSASGRGADGVHRTLVQRKLSVHFVGERDGSMVQMADLDRRCAHAGSTGNRGFGCEMVSPGYPHGSFGADWGPTVGTHVHGRKLTAYAFTDAQIRTWVALCETLAARFGWPRQVPDTDRVLTRDELARWRGVLEHLHLTMKKVDAGMLLTGALRQAGWQAVNPV